MPNVGPKEKIYDDEIAPLMTKIIDACKRANINFFTYYHLDDNLACHTAINIDEEDEEGRAAVSKFYLLRQRLARPACTSITILTEEKPK